MRPVCEDQPHFFDSKQTGIAFQHISRVEQGKYNVTIDTLALISHQLGIEIKIE